MRASRKSAQPQQIDLRGVQSVDAHIGDRLRKRRVTAGASQQKLAAAVGVTFQQIQKYEKGLNRITASRLRDLGEALGVPPSFFFEGLASRINLQPTIIDKKGNLTDRDLSYETDPAQARETLDLVRAYLRIPLADVRKCIRDLIRSVADAHQDILPVVRTARVSR